MSNEIKIGSQDPNTSATEAPLSPGRRKFLKRAAGLGALTAAAPALQLSGGSTQLSTGGLSGVKNCIFLVVDGMGRGTLSASNEYALDQTGRELHWLK